MRKAITIAALILLTVFIAGCRGSLLDKVSESLNVTEPHIEDVLKISEDHRIGKYAVSSKFSIEEGRVVNYAYYVENTKTGRIINADYYCNQDSDCKGFGWEFSCMNINSEEYKLLKRATPENATGFVSSVEDQCICSNNECFYNGEPFSWMKENVPSDAVIMMWWDFGKNAKVMGLNPIIKNPSKTAIDTVGQCNTEEVSPFCKQMIKEVEPDEKVEDVIDFFVSTDPNVSLCIAHKYDAEYVLMDSHTVNVYATLNYIKKIMEDEESGEIEELGEYNDSSDVQPTASRLFYFDGAGTNFVLVHSYDNPIMGEGISKVFKINYPENIGEMCKSVE